MPPSPPGWDPGPAHDRSSPAFRAPDGADTVPWIVGRDPPAVPWDVCGDSSPAFGAMQVIGSQPNMRF
eukprot:12411791-Karenia_brevis.AAC.1